MAINSREKGAAGEREWRDVLRDRGFEAERTCQNQGKPGEDGDVRCRGLPFDFNHEVKRVERLNIYTAMDQSIGDCNGDQVPIVAHRRNHKSWLVTMMATHWLDVMQYVNWLESQMNDTGIADYFADHPDAFI